MKTLLERPIEGDWPYLWIDATYLKVRRGDRVASVAVIIAVGVNTKGRREVLGMEVGTSEAEAGVDPLPYPCACSQPAMGSSNALGERVRTERRFLLENRVYHGTKCRLVVEVIVPPGVGAKVRGVGDRIAARGRNF